MKFKKNKKRILMTKITQILFLFIIFAPFFITHSLFAQINNEDLATLFPYRKENPKKIQLSLNTLLFVHNREYFNNIADGYTLMGYWINPKMAYQPSEKVVLEAGVFLRKEIGSSGLAEIEPTFTVKIRQNNWNFLLGNLEGNLNHRLIEPLMNFERILTKPLEHGLQIKYLNSNKPQGLTFLDFWVDYQLSTIAGRSNQEHFFGGFSSNFKLLKIKDLQMEGIAQTSIFHEGGQNLFNNPLAARVMLNPAIGLTLQKNLHKATIDNQPETFINKISLDGYYVGYFELDKPQGIAFYANASLAVNRWQFILSYWNSQDFVSPFGGDLYQSASRSFGKENYYETRRELFFLRLIKDWKIVDGMYVSVRFEPYYDLHNQLFEHAEGVYLKYGI